MAAQLSRVCRPSVENIPRDIVDATQLRKLRAELVPENLHSRMHRGTDAFDLATQMRAGLAEGASDNRDIASIQPGGAYAAPVHATTDTRRASNATVYANKSSTTLECDTPRRIRRCMPRSCRLSRAAPRLAGSKTILRIATSGGTR